MFSLTAQDEYYQALLDKNSCYEGVFYAGIKTTNIFCRPTCTARKPKPENCEYFKTAQDALLAGYRPCKRCHPLSYPGESSKLVKTLIAAVEANPEKRWKDEDFRALGVDSSTVRRQFQKRFGMTFVAYARARRMGLALKEIRNGSSVINAQLDTGYESDSGFRDAFTRIMGTAPSTKPGNVLKAEWLDSPLGPMIAIADDDGLCLLEFTDRRGLEREIERLRIRRKCTIVPCKGPFIDQIKKELEAYFAGNLQTFTTPLSYVGTDFQIAVWQTLQTVPYGSTRTYSQLARMIGKTNATRAAGRANGANQLAIIVPCHRIIGMDGSLTGYGGGLTRKQWLIEHEQSHA